MCFGRFFVFVTFLVSLICVTTQLTDKEYASMPSVFNMDDYDNCWQLEDEFLYCSIDFTLKPRNQSDEPRVWKYIREANQRKNSYRHDIIRHGVCIPKSCPEAQGHPVNDLNSIRRKLERCLNRKYANMSLEGKVTDIRCENHESPYTMGLSEQLFGIAVVCYVAFVIFATIYDGCVTYNQEGNDKIATTAPKSIISSFSLIRNWQRLRTVNYDDPNIQALSSIQGIRFYTMILVILSHSAMANMAGPVSNPIYVENMYRNLTTVMLENGSVVVQTFFMISAWLMMYQFLQQFEGREIPPKIFILAFLNRLLRLTPVFAIVLLYQATLMPHGGRGPYWDPFVGLESRRCRDHGWSNLLFINNYVKGFEMCMPHTWYMAVDTQFFILGLFIIWYTWNNIKKLLTISITLIVLHVAVLFYIIYSNHWESPVRPDSEELYLFKILGYVRWHRMWASNYGSVSSLAVGLIFGYLFHNYRNQNLFTKKWHRVTYWFIHWGLVLGILIVPAYVMHFSSLEKNERLYNAIFGCTSKTIFIIGIGIGVFGMTQKQGWFQNWICEWKPTYVLGRLTYSTYLVHMILIRIRIGQARAPKFLSDYVLAMDVMGDNVAAFLMGLILTLFVELPVSDLQKRIFSQHVKPHAKIN